MESKSFNDKKEELEARSIWRIISEGRRLILLSIFLGLALAIAVSLIMPKVYKSEALLRLSLEQPQFSIFSQNALAPSPQVIDPVSSELEVIKSRSILRWVASEQGLYVVTKGDHPFGFTNSNVSLAFRGGRYEIEVYPSGQFVMRSLKGDFEAQGKLNEPFETESFSFVLKGDPPTSRERIALEIKSQDDVLRSLRRSLSVHQKGKTNIAVVSVKASDPEKAASLANAVCNAYVDFTVSDQRKVAKSMRDFTEKQLEEVEQELARDEKALMEAKEKAGTYSILTLGNMTGPASEIIKNLATLERNRGNAIAAQREAETRLALLKRELNKGQGVYKEHTELASVPVVSNNPIVLDLKERLSLLESEKARLLQTYTENHPDVLALQRKIDMTKSNLSQAVREMVKAGPSATDPLYIELVTNYVSTEAQLQSLKDRIKVYDDLIKKEEARIGELPVKEAEMTRLLRKVETGRSLYTMLLSRLQEARIQEAKEVGDARVIDAAVPPLHPISPRIPINIFLGVSMGLLLGLFVAMSKETLDTSIRSIQDLEKVTNSIALGALPFIDDLKRSHRREKKEAGACLIVQRFPDSPEAEAFRALSSRLKFASAGMTLKSFFLTSSLGEEGKSTIALNLAFSLAERGYRTLIVDADLRKPTLDRLLDIPRHPGFSDLLQGKAELLSVVKRWRHEKFFVLSAGSYLPNPAEFIGSDKMAAVLTRMEEQFDYVIFDTPPILPFTDALELGTQVDGGFLVVKAGRTKREVVAEAVKLLTMANVRLIGTILNGLRREQSDYYSYKYHYHYYHKSQKKSKNPLRKYLRKNITFSSKPTS